ncbi:MAG: carboxypeptidase-like regulatory domain-containing protein [Planctomycetota bacterium]
MRSGVTILAAVTVLAVAALAYVAFGSGESGPDSGSSTTDPSDPVAQAVDHREPQARTEPTRPGERVPRSDDPSLSRDPKLDFGDLLATIGGKRAIVGRVVDAESEGVRAAPVWLLHPDDDADVDRRTTDDRGRFAFPLDLDDEGFTSVRIAAHDPGSGLTPIETIDLSGDARVFVVTLRGRDALGVIEGRVLGMDGRPLDGHAVQVARVDDFDLDHPEWRAGADSAEVSTIADGRYVVRGLRPGRYEVNATPTVNVASSAWSIEDEESVREVDTGSVAVDLKITKLVRVDVSAVTAEGSPRAADRLALIVFAGPAAMTVSSRFRSGAAWNLPEHPPTTELFEPGPRSRASFWVPVDQFVVARCETADAQDVNGAWIDGRAGIVDIAVAPTPASPGIVRWTCRDAADRSISPVFLRILDASGRPRVPSGAIEIVEGWFEPAAGGEFAVPQGRFAYRALAQALVTTDGIRVGGYLPIVGELAVDSAMPTELRLRPEPAANVEFLVTAAPTTRSTTDAKWFAGEVAGQRILRAHAGAELANIGDPVSLLLTIDGDASDPRRREVAGLPFRPGETVRVLASGPLAPGDASLWCTSWRVAPEDEPRAQWPVRLLPGRNSFRVAIDAELMIHFLGR